MHGVTYKKPTEKQTTFNFFVEICLLILMISMIIGVFGGVVYFFYKIMFAYSRERYF